MHARFGFDLTGLSLRATDIDWSFSSGTPIRGASGDLALVLCGRTLPPGRVAGDPTDRGMGNRPPGLLPAPRRVGPRQGVPAAPGARRRTPLKVGDEMATQDSLLSVAHGSWRARLIRR